MAEIHNYEIPQSHLYTHKLILYIIKYLPDRHTPLPWHHLLQNTIKMTTRLYVRGSGDL